VASGRVLPLGDPNALTNLLVGAASESVNKESLLAKHTATIRSMTHSTTDRSQITKQLHSTFAASGVQVNTLSVEQYYEDSDQGNNNVDLWFKASKISDVKDKIQQVGIRSSVYHFFLNPTWSGQWFSYRAQVSLQWDPPNFFGDATHQS